MLLASLALRLRLSEDHHAVWLVLVPEGTERVVALELRDQIIEQGGAACVLPGDEPSSGTIVLITLENDAPAGEYARVDDLRSTLVEAHTVAFVIAESRADELLRDAPHTASFVAGRVVSTTAEDDDAPPEYVQRRLESLREALGMTDEQAREAFESGRLAGNAHLLEWMILLGESQEGGESP